MSTIHWPPSLAARLINLRLRNQTRSMNESLNGYQQVAASVTQRWVLTLEFNIIKPQYVPTYRALIAALRGRENWLRIPIDDVAFRATDAELGLAIVPHDDDAYFDDTSGYSTADVDLTVSGTLGTRSLEVDFGDYGEVITAGLYFGIDDDLYIATGVTWDGTTATITHEPSLRRTYTDARFRLRPYLICRLTDDEVGDHPLDFGRWTSPVLNLEEVLT